jgi:hypothetical protein
MYHNPRRQEPTQGPTLGGLRLSRGASNSHRKHISVGFLLANHGLRCYRASTLLQRMLVLCKANPSPSACPSNHSHHVAVRRLGSRLGRTPKENSRGLHPLAHRHRQVFQVDQSPSHYQRQIRASHVVLHQHHPSLWGFPTALSRTTTPSSPAESFWNSTTTITSVCSG